MLIPQTRIGESVTGLTFWGTHEALEEGMESYFEFHEGESMGCQIEGTCAHHSHGFYAPQWDLEAIYPMTFLGLVEQSPDRSSHEEYYKLNLEEDFVFLRHTVSYFQHTKLEEICEEDVPADLWDEERIQKEIEAWHKENPPQIIKLDLSVKYPRPARTDRPPRYRTSQGERPQGQKL